MAKNDTPVGTLKTNYSSGGGQSSGGNTASVKKGSIKPAAKGTKVKKSLGDKFTDAFVKEDMKSVGRYIFKEKIVPDFIQIVRDAIYDAITMHFGLGGSRGSSKPSGYTNYAKASTSGSSYSYRSESGKVEKKAEGPRDFRDISFDSGEDASDALGALRHYAKEYGRVTVADFYEFSGLTASSFTDNNWGWTGDMLVNVGVERRMINHELRYFINFPDPVPID